jgi:predicted DNA-binding transcriptional regulator AlpA
MTHHELRSVEMDQDNFLTEAVTSTVTTLSPATIRRKVAAGDFPPPIYISERRKAWKGSAVRQWMAERENPVAA